MENAAENASQKPVGLAGFSVEILAALDYAFVLVESQKPVGLAGFSVTKQVLHVYCTQVKSQKPVGLAGFSVESESTGSYPGMLSRHKSLSA